jgi:hypothetical protein
VPCSWVSSRGEAERFLYCDGPTLARTPVIATLADDSAGAAPRLKLRVLDREREVFPVNTRPLFITTEEPATTAPAHERQGLFIRVQAARAVGYAVDIPDNDVPMDVRPLDASQKHYESQAPRRRQRT